MQSRDIVRVGDSCSNFLSVNLDHKYEEPYTRLSKATRTTTPDKQVLIQWVSIISSVRLNRNL
jgi:hypothetical protein